MKKRLLYLILPIITLVLEILPYGAVLNFATSPEHQYQETYSYFSLIPFGYANFAPFITAILTCAVLIMLIIFCITGKQNLAKFTCILTCACAVISFGPLIFGFSYFSIVGVLISLTLIAEFLLLLLTNRSPKITE